MRECENCGLEWLTYDNQVLCWCGEIIETGAERPERKGC